VTKTNFLKQFSTPVTLSGNGYIYKKPVGNISLLRALSGNSVSVNGTERQRSLLQIQMMFICLEMCDVSHGGAKN